MTTWTDEGVCAGGTVGGEGAGESFERRFTAKLPDGTYAVVTSYYYPVNIGERWGEEREDAAAFDVENMTIATICTDVDDVGGTEVTSEIDYDFPAYCSFLLEADAITYAEGAARGERAVMYGEPSDWSAR